MVEERKEGLKEEFADNKGDAASAEQNDTRRFRFLCGHEILSVAAGQWKAIVSIPYHRGGISGQSICPGW
jgi:hypothetical protein